ncbi:BCCT, betaine/carnitine/choline family transporter [Ruaniaceae bacterium KH17]|nr:BCCT, betaine/carnitine/choline family transporter [Ruaniaceae bacterium KH17]
MPWCDVQDWIVANLGWYYVLVVAFFVLFVIVLAASPFGRIKLGRDNEEPEFGVLSWFSSWSILYPGWWTQWAPFVGMLIARISRSRVADARLTVCGLRRSLGSPSILGL